MPSPVVDKLHAALNQVPAPPEIQETFAKMGTLATSSKSPEEAQAFVAAEIARWKKIVDDSGIGPD